MAATPPIWLADLFINGGRCHTNPSFECNSYRGWSACHQPARGLPCPGSDHPNERTELERLMSRGMPRAATDPPITTLEGRSPGGDKPCLFSWCLLRTTSQMAERRRGCTQ